MSSPPDTPSQSFSLFPKSRSLFAESPLIATRVPHSNQDDLTLDQLSMAETTPLKPTRPSKIRLFGEDSPGDALDDFPGEGPVSWSEAGDETKANDQSLVADDETRKEDEVEEDNLHSSASTPTKSPVVTAAMRRQAQDDELRTALFQMRKINGILVAHLDALNATEMNHQRLSQQVENSHELLTKYTAILSQTEHTARLLLDPTWEGGEADEIRLADAENRRAKEKERLEREEQERLERARLEKEAQARETEIKERAAVGSTGDRGKTSGFRARGRVGTTRGTAPTGTSSIRGRGSPTTSGIRRPTVLRAGAPRSRGRGITPSS